MEKEIELLTRVAANYLILGEFEPLRAALLSLRRRRPAVSLAFLRRIVFSGGRIPSVLPSPSAPSASHLAWLASLELDHPDPRSLFLKTEFLLLVQIIISKLTPPAVESAAILTRLLDFGVQRLKNDIADVVDVIEVKSSVEPISEDESKCLYEAVLEQKEIFKSLCGNIEQQMRMLEPEAPELAIVVIPEGEREDVGVGDVEVLGRVQRCVQLAHLQAMRARVAEGDVDGAVRCLPFLTLGHGVDVAEYRYIFWFC